MFVLLVAGFIGGSASAMSVNHLLCEGRIAPLNVDAAQPVLSWQLGSDRRSDQQTAYEILVASSREMLAQNQADLWDSKKVASGDSIQVLYAGNALRSGQACYWKVRVWDEQDQASPYSEAVEWGMGLLSGGDWKAHWIKQSDNPTTRPLPILRKQFRVDKPLKRAVMFISGLGQFELHINGAPASSDLLQPGWTNYRKTVLYCAYDLTSQLKPGANVVGVMLGNGMYDVPNQRYHKFTGSFGPPVLMAQLQLEFADGSTEIVGTDSQWKISSGPITFSSTYGGEDYDARLAPDGWDASGFDDSRWEFAVETDGPGGSLAGSTRSAPAIQVAQVIQPVKVTEAHPGVWVYDLGQNCSQIPRIHVSGPAGTSVRITPGELLASDGTVTQTQSGKGAFYTYTLKGSARGTEETWSPRFMYYGSRYMQVEGLPPEPLKLEGLFITSTSPAVGEFACSNDLFTRTNTLIRWSIQSNLMSLLTDCPHREKLGWLEQDHLMGPSLLYNFDLRTLFNKTCWDMSDAQLANGLVPDIAPEYTVFSGGFRDSPEWGSSSVLVPWELYTWYGDLAALRDHYDMMRKYVAYLGTRATGGIVNHGLGDWYDLGPKRPGQAQLTPVALTATAFYYRDLQVLKQTAHLLGHDDEAAQLALTAEEVKTAFNKTLYDATNHRYAKGSQAGDAIPLVFGLVPAGDEAAVLDDLVKDIRNHNDGLTAGDVGYRYVLRALSAGGRSDVIYDMNRRSDRPGYGYQLEHGATSLTEAWNADARSSQDHFMLGHIMEWFYSGLAGIDQADDSVAFNHLLIRPAMVGDIHSASATYDSVRGPVSCSWQRAADGVKLNITIPPGAEAEVYMPAKSAQVVSEGGQIASSAMGVKFERLDGAAAVFKVESGKYEFSAK